MRRLDYSICHPRRAAQWSAGSRSVRCCNVRRSSRWCCRGWSGSISRARSRCSGRGCAGAGRRGCWRCRAFVVIWKADGRPGFSGVAGGIARRRRADGVPCAMAVQALRLPRSQTSAPIVVDPPSFSRSRKAARRRGGINPGRAAGRRAAEQQAAYPAVAPLILRSSRQQETYEAALASKASVEGGCSIARRMRRRGRGRAHRGGGSPAGHGLSRRCQYPHPPARDRRARGHPRGHPPMAARLRRQRSPRPGLRPGADSISPS